MELTPTRCAVSGCAYPMPHEHTQSTCGPYPMQEATNVITIPAGGLTLSAVSTPEAIEKIAPGVPAERVVYAFGHLVASFGTDAHSADSGDLAEDEFVAMGLGRSLSLLRALAEEVAGNYQYTGEADDTVLRITSGEL